MESSCTPFISTGIGPAFIVLIIALVIWELAWKAIALWKSARLGQKGWFVCLFIFNTIGILPILYIYVFSKKKGGECCSKVVK